MACVGLAGIIVVFAELSIVNLRSATEVFVRAPLGILIAVARQLGIESVE